MEMFLLLEREIEDTLGTPNVISFCQKPTVHQEREVLILMIPPKNKQAVIVSYMKKLVDNRQSKAQVNRILDQYDQFVEKDLSLSSTLLKMGPMLGLMGTLIPMGPALVGLSTGDIASMAYNMQVAFATTVVGLFSAAIGFVTKQTKNRWYTEDMSNLEFMADLLEEK